MKVINIQISNCEECPHFGYNDFINENQCYKSQEILFFDDYTNENKEPKIADSCPLEDLI